MGSLEQLKSLVAEMFAQAENKSDVEALSAIKAACDDVEAEHNKLEAENRELLKDYKELVVHTSFKDTKNTPADTVSGELVDIDEALANAIKELEK